MASAPYSSIMIVPADPTRTPAIDWAADAVQIDPTLGHAVLPAEWDAPEDEGLYNDLA